jgi:hypothetical protein
MALRMNAHTGSPHDHRLMVQPHSVTTRAQADGTTTVSALEQTDGASTQSVSPHEKTDGAATQSVSPLEQTDGAASLCRHTSTD